MNKEEIIEIANKLYEEGLTTDATDFSPSAPYIPRDGFIIIKINNAYPFSLTQEIVKNLERLQYTVEMMNDNRLKIYYKEFDNALDAVFNDYFLNG